MNCVNILALFLWCLHQLNKVKLQKDKGTNYFVFMNFTNPSYHIKREIHQSWKVPIFISVMYVTVCSGKTWNGQYHFRVTVHYQFYLDKQQRIFSNIKSIPYYSVKLSTIRTDHHFRWDLLLFQTNVCWHVPFCTNQSNILSPNGYGSSNCSFSDTIIVFLSTNKK